MILEITIMGTAVPQGSKVANRWGGGVRDANAAKLAPWRDTVTAAARAAYERAAGPDPAPMTAAVALDVTFCVARPRSHYGTGRNAGIVRGSAPSIPHSAKPDLDKLLRAIGDSITAAGVIRDDCQISTINARKVWDERGITYILIEPERL